MPSKRTCNLSILLLAGWTIPTDINNGLNDFIYNSFAYLGNQGYAGQRYPIWVGEFGTGLDLFSNVPAYLNDLDAQFWGEPSLACIAVLQSCCMLHESEVASTHHAVQHLYRLEVEHSCCQDSPACPAALHPNAVH